MQGYDCQNGACAVACTTRACRSKHTAHRIDSGSVGKHGAEAEELLAAVEYFAYPQDAFTGHYGDQRIWRIAELTPVDDDTPPPGRPDWWPHRATPE